MLGYFSFGLWENTFHSHYTVSDLLASGIVSGKGSLQGGLLALEFSYKAMYLQAPGDSRIVDI